MHAVWLIVAKTRISAALVASSPEAGVEDVSVLFEISAELVPDLPETAAALNRDVRDRDSRERV